MSLRDFLELLVLFGSVLATVRWVVFPLLDKAWLAASSRTLPTLADSLLDTFSSSRKDRVRALVEEVLMPTLTQHQDHANRIGAVEVLADATKTIVDSHAHVLEEIPNIRVAMERSNATMKYVGESMEHLAEVLDSIRDDHSTMKGYLQAKDPETWDREERRQKERRTGTDRRHVG